MFYASGWSVVFKHDYIDENGKYRQIALVRNDFMLNMSDKLREERKKNFEKLIEKMKEKIADSKDGTVPLLHISAGRRVVLKVTIIGFIERMKSRRDFITV